MKRLFALLTLLVLTSVAQGQASNTSPVQPNTDSTKQLVMPMILTDFSVTANLENQVNIKFSSSVQADVDKIVVERSTDGKNFLPLFIIPPVGARNVYTTYTVVDRTPAQGANYYRLAELRLNGKWYYFTTKLITITRKGPGFHAYYNGGQILANISTVPGQYEVSLVDMSGIIISRKALNLGTGNGQVLFDAPNRTGTYLVTVQGHGYREVTRVAVAR